MVSETQPIQAHFDITNPPFTGGGTQASTGFISTSIPDGPSLGYTTNAFTITGSGDFSIDTTDPEYPLGSLWQASGVYGNTPQTTNFAMYPVFGSTGYPTCTQLGLSSPDNSWDCLVYVTFNPTQPGLRTGQLVATTANGAVYNFQLTGTGTGGQLAIDGGQQQAVATSAANGLGTLSSIAVTSGGTGYIADPTNNRIVVETPTNQTTVHTVIGSSITVSNMLYGQTTTASSTLSNPMGVAVDAAGNVYIADTGNSRILKYNPVTGTANQLGNYLWIPGATCDGGITPAAANCTYTAYTLAGAGYSSSILNEPGASVTPTTAPPQYKFKNPQGLAVDQWGNVYVADTGNSVIVQIPSDTKLGGATQLFQYPGAPTLTTPVAVAINSARVTLRSGQILARIYLRCRHWKSAVRSFATAGRLRPAADDDHAGRRQAPLRCRYLQPFRYLAARSSLTRTGLRWTRPGTSISRTAQATRSGRCPLWSTKPSFLSSSALLG